MGDVFYILICGQHDGWANLLLSDVFIHIINHEKPNKMLQIYCIKDDDALTIHGFVCLYVMTNE